MVITVINSRSSSDSSGRGAAPKRFMGSPSSGFTTPLRTSSDSSSSSSSRDSTPIRNTGSIPKTSLRKTGRALIKPTQPFQYTLNISTSGPSTLTASRSWQNLSAEKCQPSFATLGTPEFQRDSRVSKSSSHLDAPSTQQIRSSSVGSPSAYARRRPCVMEPEKLPAIFSIFD